MEPYEYGTKILIINAGKGATAYNNRTGIVVENHTTKSMGGLLDEMEGMYVYLEEECMCIKVNYPGVKNAEYRIIKDGEGYKKHKIVKIDNYGISDLLFQCDNEWEALPALKMQTKIYQEGIKKGICNVYMSISE